MMEYLLHYPSHHLKTKFAKARLSQVRVRSVGLGKDR